jgi:hypothetical protein
MSVSPPSSPTDEIAPSRAWPAALTRARRLWDTRVVALCESPLLAFGALFLAGVVLLGMAFLLRGTWYGDPDIYLPYARNFAHGDFFSYNPHEFSSGSTSPLWPVLLAGSYLIGAGAGGAKVVALIVTLVAFALVVEAARRTSGSLVTAALASFFVLPTLGFFGAELYESPLVVALVALTIVLGDRLLRAGTPGWRDLAPLVAVWAALPLARPDSAMLVALEALALWWMWPFGGGRGTRRLLAGAVVAAIPALAYFGYSQATLGTFSTSSQGRAFALQEFSNRLGPLYVTDDLPRYLLSSPVFYAVLPAVIGLVLLARGPRQRRWLALYGGGALVGYALLLTFVSPGGFDTPRYLLPAAPFIIAGCARALEAVRPSALWPVAAALALILIAWPAVHSSVSRAREVKRYGYTFDQVMERAAADAVNSRARPGDSVLAYEVQVRYFVRDDVSVLSLDGITDGKVADYHEDVTGFLRRYRPRFWIASDATGTSARPYLRRSVLNQVVSRFKSDPQLTSYTAGGMVFNLVARRSDGVPYLFGGWTRVFEIHYP